MISQWKEKKKLEYRAGFVENDCVTIRIAHVIEIQIQNRINLKKTFSDFLFSFIDCDDYAFASDK